MAQSERAELIAQSQAALEHFVHQQPRYSIDAVQPEYRGGTNFVTFGQRGQQPVIFKYFGRTYRWAHEYFCLRHFAQTGHVPQVLDVVPERLIVMTRLPNSDTESGPSGLLQRKQVSREIGQAVADLVQCPLPPAAQRPAAASEFEQFAWRTDLKTIFDNCIALCWSIHEKVPAYQTPLLAESLAFAEQQIEFIDRQPRMLFHEDIPNLCVYQGHFQGFYDLEMVRIGTEAMQLGVALDLCKPHWLDEDWLVWSDFLTGYQERIDRRLTEPDFCAILAMNHFYYHIRLCRWGEWDGDPGQAKSMDFAARMAVHYHEQMQAACSSISEWVNVKRWFPSISGRH